METCQNSHVNDLVGNFVDCKGDLPGWKANLVKIVSYIWKTSHCSSD